MKIYLKYLVTVFTLAIPIGAALAQAPLPESRENPIEYRSVDEALTALRMRPDVTISEQNGWTLVSDPKSYVYWSFAPKSDPAYPAVAKRQIKTAGDNLFISLNVLCQAQKKPCDDFVRQFQALNERMKSDMRDKINAANP